MQPNADWRRTGNNDNYCFLFLFSFTIDSYKNFSVMQMEKKLGGRGKRLPLHLHEGEAGGEGDRDAVSTLAPFRVFVHCPSLL